MAVIVSGSATLTTRKTTLVFHGSGGMREVEGGGDRCWVWSIEGCYDLHMKSILEWKG